MASNFHVFSYKTRDTLHLRLSGDFDGTSAFQLLKTLKKQKAGFDQIFIDVNKCSNVECSGINWKEEVTFS